MGFLKAWAAAAVVAGAFAIQSTPASASDFVCTQAAIHAKAQYVQSFWEWLNSPASDNSSAQVMQAKLDKLWDGRGDCNGDESMSGFSHQTQMDLLKTHFYGDMMTVAFNIGAKRYDIARRHMDDWFEADKLIRTNRDGMDDQLVADDSRHRSEMLAFNGKLLKAGFKTKFKS